MRDMEHQRQIIDTFVNSVYVFDDRVVLNFNFTDDSKTISREEVLGSSAVDNAPPQKSSDFRLRIFFVGEVAAPHRGALTTPAGRVSLHPTGVLFCPPRLPRMWSFSTVLPSVWWGGQNNTNKPGQRRRCSPVSVFLFFMLVF